MSTSRSSLEMISISFASLIVMNSSPSIISWKCFSTNFLALLMRSVQEWISAKQWMPRQLDSSMF